MTETEKGIDELLQSRLPSAIAAEDARLRANGISDADLAATKAAVAAVGLGAVAPTPPPATVRERLLASRTRPGKYGVFADRVARLFDMPLADAAALMLRIEKPEAWTPFLVDGVEMIAADAGPRCAGAIATLVRLQPGAVWPDHAHRGDETMVVLDGGFREPDGTEVWRGDEIFRPDGTEHALHALPGIPCIAAIVIFGYGDFT